MAKPRELRRRIKSVENTRQITKTMEMVATSRLKRAQDRVRAARPYAEALTEVISNLYSPELTDLFPLLRQPRGDPSRVALILITSNRGLCGAFNGNLIRKAKERLSQYGVRGVPVELHGIGRKGIGYFKYVGHDLASERDDIGDRPKAHHAAEVMEPLMERFQTGELDAVEVIFAKFNSPLSTPPRLMPILPVTPPSDSGALRASEAAAAERPLQRRTVNFLLKPSAEGIVGAILPLYVRNSMYRALAETAASEHGARRTAMKSATDNAGEMLDVLRRNYNRARQAVITQELAEIVGGAEALKG
ncbi:MAG: ATP synthase F1 subunit gamma [Gemmatimonadota bacterium]|nr:MAG: ATP synthase F1 subunit gamma [Gemmatimonadota bacterium]